MHGSLLMDGEVVASWRRDPRSDDLNLMPWADELPAEAIAEFEELRAFYTSTSAG